MNPCVTPDAESGIAALSPDQKIHGELRWVPEMDGYLLDELGFIPNCEMVTFGIEESLLRLRHRIDRLSNKLRFVGSSTPYHACWIQTYLGIKFSPFKIAPGDIQIEDIAHALSLVNRFTGHTEYAYSVAEHSVRCSRLFDAGEPMLALEALLHDASEAYLSDIARPIKMHPALAGYRQLERRIEGAIADKFGLPCPPSDEVKKADTIMLATEVRDLMGPVPEPWNLPYPPDDERIEPWTADEAEEAFLLEYYRLRKAVRRETR